MYKEDIYMFHDLKVFFHCLFCNQLAECPRSFIPDNEPKFCNVSDEEDFELFELVTCVNPMEE